MQDRLTGRANGQTRKENHPGEGGFFPMSGEKIAITGEKIAIIGTGPSAARLATGLPARSRKYILGRTKALAAALADEVGAIATDQPAALRGVDLLFLVEPDAVTSEQLEAALTFLAPGALVVLFATRPEPGALLDVRSNLSLTTVPAWLAEDLVLIGAVGGEADEILPRLLQGIGTVMVAPASNFIEIDRVVEEIMRSAVAALRERLGPLAPDPRLAAAVIASIAPMRLAALAHEGSLPIA
jgi:hypothetical protein